MPTLGTRRLQDITKHDVNGLYRQLATSLSPRTVHFVHVTLKQCLATAVDEDLITTNPADKATAPSAGEPDVKTTLNQIQISALVRGFQGHPLYEFVNLAADTGMRRNEMLVFTWSDVNFAKKTIRINKSLEETHEHGRRTKPPKPNLATAPSRSRTSFLLSSVLCASGTNVSMPAYPMGPTLICLW